MTTPQITFRAQRLDERFSRDESRVITKTFLPGGKKRIKTVIQRTLDLSDEAVRNVLEQVSTEFSDRHKDLNSIFRRNFEKVADFLPKEVTPTDEQILLLGAYFTHEYSIQSAAFFNPSIVPHPNQKGLKKGELRFIISFRSTGEGHISSIEFRSGVLTTTNKLLLDPVGRFVETPEIVRNPAYEKANFIRKLAEMDALNEVSEALLNDLGEEFSFDELETNVREFKNEHFSRGVIRRAARDMFWLANANYVVQFDESHDISERVIFPVSEIESRGIEDARFVRFVEDNGDVKYFATVTAYNGFQIVPELMQTNDFLRFRMITLNGKCAKDKGMALFPRRIRGNYMMVSRIDGERLYLMSSKNVHFWEDADLLAEPTEPWEAVQIGNCGPPIETPEGWLLLTHGVGPIRQYCIGAMLLDLADPSKVIGKLNDPILVPAKSEREGYVPNVVYSCGALIHNGEVIIPYAMSDTSSAVAVAPLCDLLGLLKASKPR